LGSQSSAGGQAPRPYSGFCPLHRGQSRSMGGSGGRRLRTFPLALVPTGPPGPWVQRLPLPAGLTVDHFPTGWPHGLGPWGPSLSWRLHNQETGRSPWGPPTSARKKDPNSCATLNAPGTGEGPGPGQSVPVGCDGRRALGAVPPGGPGASYPACPYFWSPSQLRGSCVQSPGRPIHPPGPGRRPGGSTLLLPAGRPFPGPRSPPAASQVAPIHVRWRR